MHKISINEKRVHNFEKEWREVYGSIWREERRGQKRQRGGLSPHLKGQVHYNNNGLLNIML